MLLAFDDDFQFSFNYVYGYLKTLLLTAGTVYGITILVCLLSYGITRVPLHFVHRFRQQDRVSLALKSTKKLIR